MFDPMLSNLSAARQHGMRGGLEKLGANRDALAQMQQLSHNLSQHQTSGLAASDAQQPQGQGLPASLPSGPASKGPRLPLRPKMQQLKQRPAPDTHTGHGLTMPLSTQEHALTPKQLPGSSSGAATGQENSLNSFQSQHMPLSAGHTHRAVPPAPPLLSDPIAASQANSNRAWHSQHLSASHQPDVTGGHTNPDSSDVQYNGFAKPGQLASSLQQSVLGQPQTASDVPGQQAYLALPVSQAYRSPTQLGKTQNML